MADITITVPDGQATRLRDSFCAATGFVAGGETKQQFMRRKIAEWVKAVARDHEATVAAAAARAAADSDLSVT